MNGNTQGRGKPIERLDRKQQGKLIQEPVTRTIPLEQLEAELVARYGRKVPVRGQYPASVAAR